MPRNESNKSSKEPVTIPSDIRLHETGQLGKLVGYLPSGSYGVRLEGRKEVVWYSKKCFDVLPSIMQPPAGFQGRSSTKPVKKQPATKGARK